MNDETIWQGSTYESTITDTDLTATTAWINLKNLETGDVIPVDPITLEEQTVNGVQLKVGTFYVDMDIVGDYSLMYIVEYEDETTAKFPAPEGDCEDGDCGLPTITVCEAPDEETS